MVDRASAGQAGRKRSCHSRARLDLPPANLPTNCCAPNRESFMMKFEECLPAIDFQELIVHVAAPGLFANFHQDFDGLKQLAQILLILTNIGRRSENQRRKRLCFIKLIYSDLAGWLQKSDFYLGSVLPCGLFFNVS